MAVGFSGGGARFQGPLSAGLTTSTIGGMEPVGTGIPTGSRLPQCGMGVKLFSSCIDNYRCRHCRTACQSAFGRCILLKSHSAACRCIHTREKCMSKGNLLKGTKNLVVDDEPDVIDTL